MENIIEVNHVTKAYQEGKRRIGALRDISFSLPKGQSMAIVGPAGSGKTTLLHLLAGIEKPSEGNISVVGKNLSNLDEKQLRSFRAQEIGFVMQFFYLQPDLTAAENISIPLLLAGKSRSEVSNKVSDLLEQVGLSKISYRFPHELTQAQLQRTAVARAMAKDPKLILVDEPIARLDKENADSMLELFDQISQSGVSVVVITNNWRLTDRFQNVLRLSNRGRVK